MCTPRLFNPNKKDTCKQMNAKPKYTFMPTYIYMYHEHKTIKIIQYTWKKKYMKYIYKSIIQNNIYICIYIHICIYVHAHVHIHIYVCT